MRTVFNKTLLEIAEKRDNIAMVLADIGYGEIEGFAEAHPDRYFNVGVAEQNMTGIACGMALEGYTVVTYSIANFPTLRCLEQIRNDVCYHNADVKIVVIGGGVSYGALGVSHHSTEDIAILRALPNMTVVVPCDCIEAEAAARAIFEMKGPVYYRCGYKNETDIHPGKIDFAIGRAIEIEGGDEAAVLFCGPVGYNASKAVRVLNAEGHRIRLISHHTVKPIDKDSIITAAKECGTIITVEEHNLCGGFGSAVAEVLADEGCLNVKFRRIALPDVNVSAVGGQEWLREKYGMDEYGIRRAILEALK